MPAEPQGIPSTLTGFGPRATSSSPVQLFLWSFVSNERSCKEEAEQRRLEQTGTKKIRIEGNKKRPLGG